MRDSIWTFVLLAVFLGIFIPAFSGASVADTATFSVANEQTSISTESWTSVEEDGMHYDDNETVYYNGSTVPESEYRWATENGSLRAVEGGTLTDASQVTISYSGERQDQWSTVLVTMAFIFFTALIIIILLVAGSVTVDAFTTGIGGGR